MAGPVWEREVVSLFLRGQGCPARLVARGGNTTLSPRKKNGSGGLGRLIFALL